ncbi:MAG: hypothetical protein WC356_04855 [Candidatus Micrarchaeia archaeon]|jgi:hypothetical protein
MDDGGWVKGQSVISCDMDLEYAKKGTTTQLAAAQTQFATLEADHLELGQLHTKTVVELYQAQTRIAVLEADLETEKLCFKSLSEHVEAHEGDLKEQLCQSQERLAEAEGYLRIYTALIPDKTVEAFLDHAPTDFVMVKREDLSWAEAVVRAKAVELDSPSAFELADRLNAACKGKEVGDE